MITVKVDGLREVQSMLAGFSDRRMNAASATGLTRTAKAAAAAWTGQLTQRIDRPTPATQRAVRWTGASADKLVAEVKVRNDGAGAPLAWLSHHETGGPRLLRKFEQALQSQGSMPTGWKAVPGPAAKLDGYGNVSRGQIVQVIAQLGAQFSPGYQRVISKSAAKRAQKAIATGRQYVAIVRKTGGLPPGVYERQGRRMSAVFWYVVSAQYRKRLDLMGEAQRTLPAMLQAEMQRAIDEHIARLAAKGRA